MGQRDTAVEGRWEWWEMELDRDHPMPLYHQIVQKLRWRIGTGGLAPGDPLPPIRDAAEAWSVNFHTVRRAYGELVELGLVESAPGRGTRVRPTEPSASSPEGAELRRFLEGVVAVAEQRFGLAPARLAHMLEGRSGSGEAGPTGPPERVASVECNEHQARDLAAQIRTRWRVEVVPWNYEAWGEPPSGPFLGTHFHRGEILRRWPHREEDAVFIPLVVDPGLTERLARTAAGRATTRAVLLERDRATGTEIARDLGPILPAGMELGVRTHPLPPSPDQLEEELVLVAPRLWDEIPPGLRADPRVLEARHVIALDDLERLGRVLGLEGT